MAVSWDDDVRWIAVTRGSLRVVANLAGTPREIDLDRPATGVLFSTGEAPRIERETVTLPAETAVVLTTA
jgi:maltooligosyltrehalose trehalohydrolase